MRKIIALILTLFISCGCIMPVCALDSSAEKEIDCRAEGDFLRSLGVFDDSELDAKSLTEKVTRGNFAKRLAKLLKKQNDVQGNVYFYDSTIIPEINALAAAGIFKGNPDGYFYPDRNITKSEAAIALVRALGYEAYVSVRGGYVSEYILFAKRLGLFSGSDMEEELNVSEMIVSFYRTLLADAYEIEAISSKGIVYTTEGQNLLWLLYDMIHIEGVVTADQFTELYSSSSLGENQIAINNKIYMSTLKTPWDYIGQNVTAFVKIADGIETVSHITVDEDKNETIILNAGEFTYKNQVIEYENEKGKIRTLTLPNSMVVIKNHQAVTGDYDKAFDITLGTVKLYKNEFLGNGYCVAVIDSAETALVEIVDFADNVIYTSNDDVKKIDCNEDGTNYVEMVVEPSGSEIGAVQLKRGDLLAVYRSENGKYTKVHLCADSISGTISTTSENGDKTTVGISGVEYEISDAFIGTKEFVVGMFGEFYFDTNGDIAHFVVKNKKEGVLYAYIYAAAKIPEPFEDKYKVKLYDENGEHNVYEFSENVKFDGVRIPVEQAYDRLLNSGTGVLKRQLVMYSLNKNGQISYIDTAAAVKEACEADGTLWKVSDITSYKYINTQHMFLPTYPLRSTRTKVFVIPKETVSSPDEKNFAVMTFNGTVPFNVETNYNVGFYKNTTTDPYMDVVLYALDEVPAYPTFKNVLIVDQIYGVYDKVSSETYVNMDCYISNYKTSVNFAEEVNLTNVDGVATTIASEKISNYVSQGDILNYSENAVGEIARISIVYDYDAKKTVWGNEYSNYATATSKYPTDGMILADVSDVYQNPSSSSSQALITVIKDGIDKEYISVLPSQFKAVVFDSSLRGNKFYVGGLDDIVTLKDTGNTTSSKLFVQKSSMYNTTFIIYK